MSAPIDIFFNDSNVYVIEKHKVITVIDANNFGNEVIKVDMLSLRVGCSDSKFSIYT